MLSESPVVRLLRMYTWYVIGKHPGYGLRMFLRRAFPVWPHPFCAIRFGSRHDRGRQVTGRRPVSAASSGRAPDKGLCGVAHIQDAYRPFAATVSLAHDSCPQTRVTVFFYKTFLFKTRSNLCAKLQNMFEPFKLIFHFNVLFQKTLFIIFIELNLFNY